MTFEEWVDHTQEGRGAHRKARKGDISEALRDAFNAGRQSRADEESLYAYNERTKRTTTGS